VYAVLLLWTLTAAAAAQPALEAPAQRTLALIYNMEFDAALAAAQTVIALAPDSPAGYYYRTAAYWQWRLVARDPQQRAALLTQIQDAVRRTLEVAERLPADRTAEAAFYLGAAYGTQARIYIAEKQYFKALGAAKKGGAYLQRCVELAPTWHDVYLGLGVYHYYLARVPGFVRGLAQWLIGLDGDRDRGIQELERARTQGSLAVPEATSMLARIYASSTEKQYDKARSLLESLVQQYPNNMDYRYRLLLAYANLGQWPQAQQTSHQLLADIAHGKMSYAQPWVPLLHYRTAETYVLQGNAEAAMSILQTLHTAPLDDTLRPWVILRLGNAYDLRGDHPTARTYYQRVEGPDGVKELAIQYGITPFTPGPITLKPSEKII
jgi:tetratricopeptide (TPR) repeat protein